MRVYNIVGRRAMIHWCAIYHRSSYLSWILKHTKWKYGALFYSRFQWLLKFCKWVVAKKRNKIHLSSTSDIICFTMLLREIEKDTLKSISFHQANLQKTQKYLQRILKLTSHSILHYLLPANISKSLSKLIFPVFIGSQ